MWVEDNEYGYQLVFNTCSTHVSKHVSTRFIEPAWFQHVSRHFNSTNKETSKPDKPVHAYFHNHVITISSRMITNILYMYVYIYILLYHNDYHFYPVSTSDPTDVPSTRSYPEVDPDASSFKAAANCCERGAMAVKWREAMYPWHPMAVFRNLLITPNH